MTFEKSDFEKLLRERQTKGAVAIRPQMERAVQASVAMEQLTGSAEWDYFLSLVQARVREFEAIRDAQKEVLLSPAATDHEARIAKIQHAAALASVDALQWAIGLPRTIRDNGEAAKQALRSTPEEAA